MEKNNDSEDKTTKIVDSYGNIKIVKNPNETLPSYHLNFPLLEATEQDLISNPEKIVDFEFRTKLDNIFDYEEKKQILKIYVEDKLKEKIGVKKENLNFIVEAIISKVMGFPYLDILMSDDNLEEIMINGTKKTVFVFHRKYGMCTTNFRYDDTSIKDLIIRVSDYTGRDIGKQKPLLDGRMPDGSRINIAIPPAAPSGPAITIRKFRKNPFSIIHLIEKGTLSVDLAAFLWLCVEGKGIRPINMIITGGAGSGKTTTLNALASFIPYYERVATVEDTLELNIGFLENYVPLEARPSVLGESFLTMNDLLKNTLRMRPDRVLVGEVRGEEAHTLFVAMDIGLNGSMGTMHANNAREATIRLTHPPMNVPYQMMSLLDLIVVQNKIYSKGKTIRRITEVSEVANVEGEIVQLGEIYKWHHNTDTISRTEYPIGLKDKMAEYTGLTRKEIDKEISTREDILWWMIDNKIKDYYEVLDIITQYKKDPDSVLKKIGIG